MSGDFPCDDPRSSPVPVPGAGVFDSPAVPLCINTEWCGHLDGLLGRLLLPDAWIGTEAEIEAAIQEVQKLLVALAQIGDCP